MSGEVSVGLLGLGNVGAAVVRATHTAARVLGARGLRIRVDAALVRDRGRARPTGIDVPVVTDSIAVFFRRRFDVIVEVLGGVQPASDLVARALGDGIPVVTANKSMLAVHGERLSALARACRTHLLFEASVVAGVPFLEALGRRPLAGAIDRVEAILNGTSNYILTSMADEGISFDDALTRAQALGYAEPDPASDVSGRDAAEKLCVLLRYLGLASIGPADIPTSPIASITAADISCARSRGGCIKPIVRARWSTSGIEASVGPEFVGPTHPLSRVDGALNGVLLQSRFVGPLFYSGPGAGPDVTAATILDDVTSLSAVDVAAGAGVTCR